MTTTGTALFNLDFAEIAEECYERLGGRELRSGYDLRTVRRSLQLLFIEWVNRGTNMWTIEQIEIPLYPNQIEYTVPVDTVELLDCVVRTGTGQNQVDININRISESTYSTIPNKNARGRPIQFWFNKQSGATTPTGVNSATINIWPTPDQGTSTTPYYTLVTWRMRRIQDVGTGVNTQDVPFRFLPAMLAGLSYYLSVKVADIDPNRIAMLKADYEEQYRMAAEEDRDTASFRAVPRIGFI